METVGERLQRFKQRFPKQHKQTGMLYSGRYNGRETIDHIRVWLLLVSDHGTFELLDVQLRKTPKTPRQWSEWLDRHFSTVLEAVIDNKETTTGMLWRVKAHLGWSDVTERSSPKVAKRARRKTKAKR